MLEDGGTFRGGIDMGDPPPNAKETATTSLGTGQKASDESQVQADLAALSGSTKGTADTVSKAKN